MVGNRPGFQGYATALQPIQIMYKSKYPQSPAAFNLVSNGNPLGGAAPTRRPRAILFVNDNTFAGVCAWCTDKEEADMWCRDQGFQATHTICPTCRARLKNEYDVSRGRWVA